MPTVKKSLRFLVAAAIGEVRFTELQYRWRRIGRNEYYDRLTEEVMKRVIRPGSVCLDVGCHEGAMLAQMLRLAPHGRFLAFEPLPHLHEALTKNFNDPRVTVYRAALSDADGTATFRYVKSNPAYSGLQERDYEKPEVIEEISVQTVRLDTLLGGLNLPEISFIKVDVEGAERLVFEGGVESLRKYRPTIAFECGLGAADHYGSKPENVYDLLCARCGLRISTVADYLHGRPPLTAADFVRHFSQGIDYFYLAHPA